SFSVLTLTVTLVAQSATREALAADAVSPSSQSNEAPKRGVTLYAALGAGSVLDTGSGTVASSRASLTLAFPLARLLALEFSGEFGNAFRGEGAPNDIWGRLTLGLRLENQDAASRFFGAFRLTHLHYAASTVWRDHPITSLA